MCCPGQPEERGQPPREHISSPRFLRAQTLSVWVILSPSPGSCLVPVSHSSSSRLEIEVGQEGLTLTSRPLRIGEGPVETQLWIMPTRCLFYNNQDSGMTLHNTTFTGLSYIRISNSSSNGLSLYDARHTDIYFMTVNKSGESGMKYINPLAILVSAFLKFTTLFPISNGILFQNSRRTIVIFTGQQNSHGVWCKTHEHNLHFCKLC